MSDSALPYCLIQGNADIAGIGVRVSTYAQACFGTIAALFLVLECLVLPDESNTLEQHLERFQLLDEIGLALLITGSALLTSTIIEAKSSAGAGMSDYHALIVLNLSWLNNVTGFTLHFFSFLVRTKNPEDESGWKRKGKKKKFLRSAWGFTLHCTIMSIIGIWFWSDPLSFSQAPTSPDATPCIPLTYYWLFTHIPLLPNNYFRIFSLVAYTATIIPLLNIAIYAFPWIVLLFSRRLLLSGGFLSAIWISALIAILTGPTVYFIISTEYLIASNSDFVDRAVEDKWTFGQTLALFLAGVSGWDVLLHIVKHWKVVRQALWKHSVKKEMGAMAGMILASQGWAFGVQPETGQITPRAKPMPYLDPQPMRDSNTSTDPEK